ncbi:butyrate kinase [Breznakiella homolactica]|uniref:Probable butyrate kinase n=2 Tax=Breznakiella homolactica TaxID=2798577 RepID=A0A7T8BDJ3_9SPIR|nr:butyrate kinase [Breznakiella homolactica]
MDQTVFVINPGSTSTKIAVYRDKKRIFSESIPLEISGEEKNAGLEETLRIKKEAISRSLESQGIDLRGFDCIMSRGGVLRPMESGIYRINESMHSEVTASAASGHASGFGLLIAGEMADSLGIPAYIADPVTVDELEDIARITGIKEIRRRSIFHALNQKAVARQHAAILGVPYEELNLIAAHLGGGITIGLHKQGRVTDVNNALDGEGPFTPERSGALPAAAVADLCFSGKYTREETVKLFAGKGGFMSHLGSNDLLKVKEMIAAGDRDADLVYRAFVYNIAKAIGAMAAAGDGMIDGILITGGIARWKELVAAIRAKVSWIAPVSSYPGEFELEALRDAGLRVLRGDEIPREY